MKEERELLEAQLERYEEQLDGLNSYIRELKAMTARHGTDGAHFEEDLLEAQHNVAYYEAEIARVKGELAATPAGRTPPRVGAGGGGGAGTTARRVAAGVLPQTARQGVGAFALSAVSFVAGALLGSRLKPRAGRGDAPPDAGER